MSSLQQSFSDVIPQDLKDAVAKFVVEAARIVDSFAATLEAYRPQPIVYHYTDDVGLSGVLASGQLWLTDIFSLNDPSELRHSLSHAIES